MPFWEGYWWSHSEEVKARMRDAVLRAASGQADRFEIEGRMGTDKFISIDFSISAIRDTTGNILYLMPIGDNISSQKRVMADLKDSQELLTVATESAQVGIWSLNFLTQELTWSDLHKTMWGYTPSSSLMYEDWHRVIHREDVEYAFSRVEKARVEHTEYNADYRIYRFNDGEERWMRSVGLFFYDEQGQPYKLTGVTLDITEEKAIEEALRKSEEHFRGTIMNLPDGFMMFESVRDQSGQITDFKWLHVNPAAERIVGRKAEDLTGKFLLQEMPGNKDAGLFDAYVNVVERRETWQNEFEYNFEGLNHYFLSRAAPLSDGFAVIFSDITIRKGFEIELERQVAERTLALQSANRLLEEKNRELEQFSFITAHDLQEPLRKIQVFGGMMRDMAKDKLDARSAANLEKIMHSAQRMRNLINDLLNFSKLTYQQDPYANLDLNEEMKTILEHFEMRIEEQKALIHIDKLPKIKGVAWQINMLFSNLIANSLKFVHPDVPPVVQVSACAVDAEEAQQRGLPAEFSYVCISVADNGIGFDSQYAKDIFIMFKRLHDRSQYDGTGIGLAICAKVVEYHQGTIEAHSVPEEGTKIDIFLIKGEE
jgi:PAS domain S-box-containing protein